MKKFFQEIWHTLKNSVLLFTKHDTGTLAAALSYYTLFSLAPLLIIVISVAGFILGPDAIEGEVKRQLQGFVGSQSATELQNIIKSAYKPGENIVMTIIALVILVVGATTVFGQLRTSLNVIWDVKPAAKKPVAKFIVSRVFSFAMIISLAFLLLISMVIHSALQAFTNYLNNRLPDISVVLFKLVDYILSMGLTMLLFSLIYKFMSDAKLKWRSVWKGALFTTVLFILGKYLIGLYISKSNLASTYGAAGSVIVILVWVFYSSQILFFGAEFTQALAIEKGVSLDPKATKTDKEKGIVNKEVLPKKE
ncbi:MAG: YihY/virulence factor BrkB family protein [Chitinophagales bacterium]